MVVQTCSSESETVNAYRVHVENLVENGHLVDKRMRYKHWNGFLWTEVAGM
jgi:hypothetical protein